MPVMDRTGVCFSAPKEVAPLKMLDLADEGSAWLWSKNNSAVEFPLKTVGQIVELISLSRENEVSILEWLVLFEDKETWDEERTKGEVEFSTVKILKTMALNSSVLHLGLFRAALALENKESRFPAILLENIFLLKQYVKSDSEIAMLEILVNAVEKDYQAIIFKALLKNLTPGQLLDNSGLARCTNLHSLAVDALELIVERLEYPKHVNWLVDVFSETKNSIKLKVLDAMLPKIDELKSSPQFIEWLNTNCHPSASDSLWFNLKAESKELLKKYLKIGCFYYVEELAKVLINQEHSRTLDIDEMTQKQITGRVVFWSHYQESFLSVRILVPPVTYVEIMEERESLQWIEVLEKSRTTTEVVILEMEKYIAIEFLRGGSNELRVFENNHRNKNLLLKQKNLSIDSIRRLFEDGVHDHVFLWQWACECWLRTNFKIEPNKGIKRFRGLPKAASIYKRNIGLPKPNDVLLSKRNKMLNIWNSDYIADEKINKKDQLGLVKIREKVIEAENARRLNNKDEMRASQKSAAILGDLKSVELLYNWYLTKPTATKKEREFGEYWYNIHQLYKEGMALRNENVLLFSSKNSGNRTTTIVKQLKLMEIPAHIINAPFNYVGIVHGNKVYRMYLLKSLRFAIYLDDDHCELSDCRPLNSTMGVRVSIDEKI